VPGVDPPTAQLETDAALAVLVFLSVIWFGVRSGGLAAISNPSPRPIR
jgi:F-type H+-transporting ATPase subunit a